MGITAVTMNEIPLPFNANRRRPQVERAALKKSFQKMQKNADDVTASAKSIQSWRLEFGAVARRFFESVLEGNHARIHL